MKLLLFSSETCAGCHQMQRFLPDVCGKAEVTLMVADIAERADLAIKYHIGTLPTLVLFKDGEPVKQVTGTLTERRFMTWLEA